MFFKGTCLSRSDQLPKLRIEWRSWSNATRSGSLRSAFTPIELKGVAPTTSGPIRDRDLKHPMQFRQTIRKAQDLGLGIQMHMIPLHAPEIAALAKRVLRARPFYRSSCSIRGKARAEQYKRYRDGRYGNVYMKFSGWAYSSKEKSPPFRDIKPLVRRTFDAFGPDRMMWGEVSVTRRKNSASAECVRFLFDFASDRDRSRIRGLTASACFWLELGEGSGPEPSLFHGVTDELPCS